MPPSPKHILLLLVVSCVTVGGFLFSPFVYAEPDRAGGDGVSGGRDGQVQEVYIPLEPLPGVEVREVATVEGFLGAAYRIGVSLAILLAVVMLMYGGIKYIVTSSSQGKGDARDTIEKALIGLLLAVGGYSLLFLIGGPGVMDVDLRFPAIEHREPVMGGFVCRADLRGPAFVPENANIGVRDCEGLFGPSRRIRGGGGQIRGVGVTRGTLDYIVRNGVTHCLHDPTGPERLPLGTLYKLDISRCPEPSTLSGGQGEGVVAEGARALFCRGEDTLMFLEPTGIETRLSYALAYAGAEGNYPVSLSFYSNRDGTFGGTAEETIELPYLVVGASGGYYDANGRVLIDGRWTRNPTVVRLRLYDPNTNDPIHEFLLGLGGVNVSNCP